MRRGKRKLKMQGVVRAERFEAVDREGRRRVSVGVIAPGLDGGDVVGMDLFDAAGRSALSLVVDDTGTACISFASAGDEILVLGTGDDAAPDQSATPFLILCSPDGDIAASLKVGPHGQLTVHPSARCSPATSPL